MHAWHLILKVEPGNTKRGSITAPLTPCLTGLDNSVLQIKTKIVSCHTADSKPVKKGGQWYSDASPFSIPWLNHTWLRFRTIGYNQMHQPEQMGHNLGRFVNCRCGRESVCHAIYS
jgi:hypothetical protein